MNYASPEEAPVCRCRDQGSAFAPTLCMSGHLTECHFPLGCREAACNHMHKYEEMAPGRMAQLEELAVSRLEGMAEQDCAECRGTGITGVSRTVEVPEYLRETLGDELVFNLNAVCRCVAQAAAANS